MSKVRRKYLTAEEFYRSKRLTAVVRTGESRIRSYMLPDPDVPVFRRGSPRENRDYYSGNVHVLVASRKSR